MINSNLKTNLTSKSILPKAIFGFLLLSLMVGGLQLIELGYKSLNVKADPAASLSVTINQSIFQNDPTSGNNVKFTAIFSEPIDIASFDASDIVLTGTASGKIVGSVIQVAPNDSTSFEINVTATSSGTIIAKIPDGAFNFVRSPFSNTASSTFGIVSDSLGNIYTTNYSDNFVTKITPSGVSSVFGTTGGAPRGITIDQFGNLYVANLQDNTVTKITPSGVSSLFGTTGNGPFDITIDKLGNIYTGNTTGNTVTKITLGGVSSVFGTTGGAPRGIQVDSNFNVYVSNAIDNNVTKITPDGTSIILGSTGIFPNKLKVDSLGNVYTANVTSKNITKITPNGISSTFGTTGDSPNDLIFDQENNLYTVNIYSFNITKIKPDGSSSTIATTSGYPLYMTSDDVGNLYVTNQSADVIDKFTKTLTTGVKSLNGKVNNASTSTDNSVNFNLLPSLGSYNQVLSGIIGQPFPSIHLNNNTVPNNTNATFVPQGSSSTIRGKILNNQFVPDPNQFIPSDATIGSSTATLSAVGFTSIIVATNFSLTPTFGSASPITGTIGSAFPNIQLSGSNLANNTPATFTITDTGSIIYGTIQGQSFIPDAGSIIPLISPTFLTSGTLSASNTPSLYISIDFTIPLISGTFQQPNSNFISYDNTHDAIANFTVIFDRNINVDSFTASDISFGFFQGCSVVLISPYYSQTSSNKFDVTLNCGRNPINDNALVYPQIGAGSVTDGSLNNGFISNRGSTLRLTYNSAAQVTIDVPAIINQNNYSNFRITGNCIFGSDVNIFINLTGENIVTQCQNSGTYSTNPQIIIYNSYFGCGVNYYDSCNYIASANQLINGNTVGSTDYGLFDNSIGNSAAANYQVNINGENYIYNNQAQVSLYCSDAQNVIVSSNLTSNFTQVCGANSNNVLNNLPSPLPNGQINITLNTTDIAGNTSQILYSAIVCNDPYYNYSAPLTFFDLGAIRASAQSLPTCTGASCDIIPQQYNILQDLLFSPISASAQTNSAADCGVIYSSSSSSSSSQLNSSNVSSIIMESSLTNSSSLTSSSPIEVSSSNSSQSSQNSSEIDSFSSTSSTILSQSSVSLSSISNSSSTNLIPSSSSQISTNSTTSISSIANSFILNTSSISSLTDGDNDGVPDYIEQSAPNNGDGNNDEIPDYTQPNIASIKEPNSDLSVTIVVTPGDGSCNSIAKAEIVKEIQNLVLDPEYEYPAGFANFEADCAGRLDVKIYWYGLDQTKTYVNRKYNPTLGIYKNIENLRQQIEEINSVKVLTFEYSIVDNGELDENPIVGKIKDPIGPGIQIANTGGVITINTQSSKTISQNSIKPSDQPIQTLLQSQTDIDKISSKALPEIKPTLETIRTGGNGSQDNLLGIILILLGFLLLTSRFTEQQTL